MNSGEFGTQAVRLVAAKFCYPERACVPLLLDALHCDQRAWIQNRALGHIDHLPPETDRVTGLFKESSSIPAVRLEIGPFAPFIPRVDEHNSLVLDKSS